MCRFAEAIAVDKPFKFKQTLMPYFRRRMVVDVINKHFSY
jgi:hypothetical protein